MITRIDHLHNEHDDDDGGGGASSQGSLEEDPRFVSPRLLGLPAWSVRTEALAGGAPDGDCLLSLCSAWDRLAATTSSNLVRIYDLETLNETLTLANHSDAIRSTRPQQNSSGLFTASEDGSWKLTDLRSGAIALTVQCENSLYSFDCNGVLAAAGIDIFGDIAIWDIRNCSGQLGVLNEFHTEEVRDLRFHPKTASILLSGSIDCLINKFDLNAENLDDALISVFNTNQSIRSFQLFGPNDEFIYCISEIETLTMCSIEQDEVISYFPDICKTLSKDLSVRYLVDCHYDELSRSLSVFAGNYYGDIIGSFASPSGLDPSMSLLNGHSSGVRSSCSINNHLFTGGEDSRIIAWKHPS